MYDSFFFEVHVFQKDKNESHECDRTKLHSEKLQFSTRYKFMLFP